MGGGRYVVGDTETTCSQTQWNPSPEKYSTLGWERAVVYIAWCGQQFRFKWETGPEILGGFCGQHFCGYVCTLQLIFLALFMKKYFLKLHLFSCMQFFSVFLISWERYFRYQFNYLLMCHLSASD